MNCVVMGGAGFIGSHLVDALVARGDRVTILDNLSTGRRENLEGALRSGAVLHAMDLRDDGALAHYLDAARPQVVFHLAAQIDVRRSVQEPREDALTNILGTIGVLGAAAAVGAERLVNSSSGGAVYGEAAVIPTPEQHPASPISPYGQGKYAAEGYCDLYARSGRLSTVSLRYSNVYGPRQDAHGEGGVVAIFSGCLSEGRAPTVFGDGHQTRDWVEVADVVRANLLAAQSDVTGPLNIGCGRETSVLELVDALNEVSQSGPLKPAVFAPARDGEVLRSCLDPSRARTELGWEANVELRDGLRKVLSGLERSADR
ncbi:MAG TPA: GDP-mannose 4,6-dehydratase [Solirubrobacteraceae bacterium]|nr:GDP-mannose 4,6-dehydratase [Solirubrobacteraceae bacterium]